MTFTDSFRFTPTSLLNLASNLLEKNHLKKDVNCQNMCKNWNTLKNEKTY